MTDLTSQLEQCNKGRKELVANLNSLRQENERKAADLTGLENRITHLTGERDVLQRSVGDVKSQLSEYEEKCEELARQVANLNSFREENEKKVAPLIDLENTFTHLNGEWNDLQKSVTDITSQLANCEEKCGELRKAVVHLNSVREESNRKADALNRVHRRHCNQKGSEWISNIIKKPVRDC